MPVGSGFLKYFQTGDPIVIVDPDEDVPGATGVVDEPEEEGDSSWSSRDPVNFYSIRDAIQRYMLDRFGINISATALNQVMNAYAGSESFTFSQLVGDEAFWTQAQRRALGSQNLPDWFWVNNPGGGRTLYNNTGGFPVPASIDDWLEATQPKSLGDRYSNPPTGSAYFLPVMDQDVFEAALNLDAFGLSRRGGGGRAAPVWDRAALYESIRSIWRPLMVEDAPANLADEYVSEWTAFSRQGGSLDLQTWVLNKMRGTGRYQSIYAHKPAELSETEYIGQYRQIAEQTGLRDALVSRETLRGAAGGAAPQAFANSLMENRDVQAMGTGNLSRRFAQTIARIPT